MKLLAHRFVLMLMPEEGWSSITVWLRSCGFTQTRCGIPRREEISQTDLLHWWHIVTVPRQNSVSSLEEPIPSQMFVKVDCTARCLIFYSCGDPKHLHSKILLSIQCMVVNGCEWFVSQNTLLRRHVLSITLPYFTV